ncbi:MAG: hypothetical protein JO093_18255 [Acidobacteria bacterium]|nr:hypothetical protein [Acidobacteriota bacterium]MBV9071287.1 hypothetical protein [Acidobacteriota bacterium]MBV9187565.1 hypothetical protein [Acidobacteriota bacterium]
MTLRQTFSLLCLAAIVVLGVASRLLELPFIDRAQSVRAMARYPDRAWPDFPLFLQGVREHTKPGDTIAVIVPAMNWDGGYSYAYYRASYFLTGREVLPLVTADNARVQKNFLAAKYIAVFGVGLRVPADIVWREGRGALLRLRQR